MKILVENGNYSFLNMGDTAMLDVTLRRLYRLWPNASIQVFTNTPDSLLKYHSDAIPLSPNGRDLYFSPLSSRAFQVPNKNIVQLCDNFERFLRRKSPGIVRSFMNWKLKKHSQELINNFDAFMEGIHHADLVVTSGGGYITDSFKKHAGYALDTLGLANRIGKPTAMFGLGLGPLKDPTLIAKATEVLPSVNLISLREKRAGLPLLNSFNVISDRVMTTGDDAIEMAYDARNPVAGNGIGINLRVATYSGLNSELLDIVRTTLKEAAKLFSATLVPVPISSNSGQGEASDHKTISELLKGYDDASDGGKSLNTPLKVIQQIGLCRVVVTGSYHAGVFALSQGIPVVGLVQSEYYADKFLGLSEQFGYGCDVLFLDDRQLKEKLLESILKAWDSSSKLRDQLLKAAEQQMFMGQSAYKHLSKIT